MNGMENVIQIAGKGITGSPRECCRIPRRYLIAFLLFLALFIVSWMENNIYATLYFYVIQRNSESNVFYRKKIVTYGWKYKDLMLLQYTFLYANAASTIPGAILTIKFPAHRVFFITILASSVAYLLWPLAMNHHYNAAITINIIQGILEGPLYPSLIRLITQWTPMEEKTRLFAFIVTGRYVGSTLGVLSYFVVNFIGDEIAFYLPAISGLFWSIIWAYYTYSSPSQDPQITEKELKQLENNVDPDAKAPITFKSIPWKSIMLSKHVWALVLASICYSLMESSCKFLPSVLHQKFTKKFFDLFVFIWTIPDGIFGFFIIVFGILADFLINRNKLSTTAARRVFVIVAFSGFAVFGIILEVLETSRASMILTHFAIMFYSLAITGAEINCLDICPHYAAIVTSVLRSIGLSTLACFPLLYNKIDHFNIDSWKIVLHFSIPVCTVAAIVFGIFGSGERQSWDKVDNQQTQNQTNGHYFPENPLEEENILISESQSL